MSDVIKLTIPIFCSLGQLEKENASLKIALHATKQEKDEMHLRYEMYNHKESNLHY